MRIGVPKEIKDNEYRVGLTPITVREYIAAGHQVLVQSTAGLGIGAEDADYQSAGASTMASAEDVFANADMIIKVKEPQPEECARLKKGQILFTYLHLASDKDQAKALMASGCTAVAYETVTDGTGALPLLAPMSEVAGRLAIQAAGEALRKSEGGRGILLPGVPGVAPANIVVIGGGVVGTNAARMAVGLGAQVTIFDRSIARLRQLDDIFQARAVTRYATLAAIEDGVMLADAVIGAVLIPGAKAPKLVNRGLLQRMKRGAVLVDVSIDQGGCFETSRPTTHTHPTYEIEGIIHYCVANMPGAVPLTSSEALNNATLPFSLRLAAGGLDAIRNDPQLMSGLNVHAGRITHRSVAASLDEPYCDPGPLLAA